ncbi:unnamed protein product [Prorocentrum cordatum]|uniref:Uncharacterized protein n=1 Tax=Prorocentrum cordatum TaxID=2364126 RepID=A0ABN9TVM4_9DINO|nr:unnamed protein product [Polarella glacialis]
MFNKEGLALADKSVVLCSDHATAKSVAKRLKARGILISPVLQTSYLGVGKSTSVSGRLSQGKVVLDLGVGYAAWATYGAWARPPSRRERREPCSLGGGVRRCRLPVPSSPWASDAMAQGSCFTRARGQEDCTLLWSPAVGTFVA